MPHLRFSQLFDQALSDGRGSRHIRQPGGYEVRFGGQDLSTPASDIAAESVSLVRIENQKIECKRDSANLAYTLEENDIFILGTSRSSLISFSLP